MASELGVQTIQHTNSTDAMTINSSGDVTVTNKLLTPARPYFYATVQSSSTDVNISTGSDHTVIFDDVIKNIGNHYDSSTYKFTVPVDGVYYLSTSLRVDVIDQAASYYRLGFRIEAGTGSTPNPPDHYLLFDPEGYDADITYRTFEVSRAVYLTAGNLVRATIRQQGGTNNHAHYSRAGSTEYVYSHFSGYLIG